MYHVTFSESCKDLEPDLYPQCITFHSAEIALSFAAFLLKANNEPGSKVVYKDVTVEPIKDVKA